MLALGGTVVILDKPLPWSGQGYLRSPEEVWYSEGKRKGSGSPQEQPVVWHPEVLPAGCWVRSGEMGLHTLKCPGWSYNPFLTRPGKQVGRGAC